MSQPHYFDSNTMEWSPHPRFPAILTKALETSATYAAASVMMVRVAAGGVIDTHTHLKETETAFVLAGRGRLTLGETEQVLTAGTGITIPPGIPHSLHNTGDTPMEIYAVHIPPVR